MSKNAIKLFWQNCSNQKCYKKIVDDIVYGPEGKWIQAEDSNKYQIIYDVGRLTDKNGNVVVAAGRDIVVNARGKIVKATTELKSVKIDDFYYDVWIDVDGSVSIIILRRINNY